MSILQLPLPIDSYRHFAVSFIETLRIRISINYYAFFFNKQIGREKNSEGPIWLLDYLIFFQSN